MTDRGSDEANEKPSPLPLPVGRAAHAIPDAHRLHDPLGMLFGYLQQPQSRAIRLPLPLLPRANGFRAHVERHGED